MVISVNIYEHFGEIFDENFDGHFGENFGGDFDENSIYVARVAEEVYPAIMKRTNNTESKIKRYHCFLCNSSFMTEKSKKRHERTSKKHLDLVGLDR